ncbi:bacterio-opsin activator [Haloprofundus marisrubri]|uniref:Bacterio-opsin activator n=1 Tax=Haloprofundus marisrubri TaxID=1514971 RepID=A0A0W1R3E7_9EURY|nr:helix-turn-helix domain-containing protein [Haloprofundus marisrubri]KTG07646.1 bacterio-opsin activator [Haloprofundus marisrubri]
MDAGIHAQIQVSGVEGCPAASLSEDVEIESVVLDRQTGSRDGTVVGEVTVDHADTEMEAPEGVQRVFDDDTRSVYRFVNRTGDCPCGRVPDHGCPVRTVRADSGSLLLSFIASDVQTLRSIVTDLRSCCGAVRVQRLTQSTPESQRLLFVNREAFTDRQYEVLQTAHEMGYFARPKRADSAAVAAELGISVATFSEHLAVAQEKLLDQVLTKK